MIVALVCLVLAAIVAVPTVIRARSYRQARRVPASHPTVRGRSNRIDVSKVIDGVTYPSRSLQALLDSERAIPPGAPIDLSDVRRRKPTKENK